MNDDEDIFEPQHKRLNDDRWRIGREIPIATIVVLTLQTVGVVWWAASTAARVEFMRETIVSAQVVQTSVDRRQDEDAQRSEGRILQQLERLNAKLDRVIEVQSIGGRK